MNRNERARIGQEAVAISMEGRYRSPSGATVEIGEDVQRAVANTRVIKPGDWKSVIRRAAAVAERPQAADIEVTGETTLQAAHRLVESGAPRVLALNFASAKNAGGGFLGGSGAQEESLARSSALYVTLQASREYYEENRRCKSCLYTDHAILSADVPVFRDDDGNLLDRPYLVSFLTMPAANVGAIRAGSPDHGRVERVMRERVFYVLALAVAEGYQDVVLGAWGCGVFKNDPWTIARLFRDSLLGDNRFAWKLQRVVFAVLDRSQDQTTLRPFQETFQKGGVS
jgi:uncharacterized protein (TIGR02452 family)